MAEPQVVWNEKVATKIIKNLEKRRAWRVATHPQPPVPKKKFSR